jgi:hypothetical protein
MIGCCVMLPSSGNACFGVSEVLAFKQARGHYRASQHYTACLVNMLT